MKKKIILLYPYYSELCGAYNRYLLLEKLLKKNNFQVNLIILKDQSFNSKYAKFFYKLFKFIKVELIIIFYSVFNNYYFITDYNPSITALFSKKVLIQIHDVSWENKKFARHKSFFYGIFRFFIKNYSNILTVSKTSMIAINKVSQRKKRTFFLYNSVSEKYLNHSKNINKENEANRISLTSNKINLAIPNILYIATLIPRKCHLELLEALAHTNKIFNVNLVGLPIDKKIVEFIKTKKTPEGKVIKSNINYFPQLSQSEICNLLIHSSVYISTSMSEGFGIPVLEAQLYNIPLIIRDIDINRELFPNAKFFNSNMELINLLNDIKKLSNNEIKQRKEIASKINQDNIAAPFNYLSLSNKLKKIILDLT